MLSYVMLCVRMFISNIKMSRTLRTAREGQWAKTKDLKTFSQFVPQLSLDWLLLFLHQIYHIYIHFKLLLGVSIKIRIKI